MTNDAFLDAFTDTVQDEGTFSDDPNDPGNWTGGKRGVGELKGTKYGISAASYPHMDIRNLTLPQAMDIYRRDFWEKLNCHRIAVFDAMLAGKLFNLGVNCGIGRAAKMLQRGLNMLCAEYPARRLNPWRQKIAQLMAGKPLLVDGQIGPITLEIMHTCPHDGAELMALRGEAYVHYSQCDPQYRLGWLERLGR